MTKFRNKPVVIEAFLYEGTEDSSIKIASDDDFEGVLDFKSGIFDGFYINTLEGKMHVSKGDYVIKGVNGEFYPCKPEIFEKTYEAVEN